jgi:hypothetical protein
MKRIFAVGGTGQIVLHYYFQLYLTGVVGEPFDAVVVDTDEILPSLDRTGRFLRDLQYHDAPGNALFGTIPTLSFVKIQPPGESAGAVLTGMRTPARSPVRAFYDRESLEMKVDFGLFGRPALSATLSVSALEDQALAPGDRAVVVGSIIGGTGGGLIAPVLSRLRDVARQTHATEHLRAVLLGEWFKPTAGVLRGDERRFQSNEAAVRTTIGAAISDLYSYVLLDRGDYLEVREKADEKGRNLTWPTPGEPLWDAVLGLHHQLTDTTTQVYTSFAEKRVRKQAFSSKLGEATRCRDDALDLTNAAVKRNVVALVGSEPVPSRIWGAGLTGLLVHFWRIARAVEGSESASSFASTVNRQVKELWNGTAESWGMRHVFPSTTRPSKVKPYRYRQAPLAQPTKAWSRTRFPDHDTIGARAAATVLFSLLRAGAAR